MPEEIQPAMLVSATTVEADVEQMIADLRSLDILIVERGIRAAQRNPERAIPRLIAAIENAAEQTLAGHPPRDNTNVAAAFLLAEFKAREALPAILQSLKLPGRLSSDLYGESISEDMPRILSALLTDDFSALDEILRKRDSDKFVRWMAGSTYVRLVRDGKLERNAVVQLLAEHLREAMRINDWEIVTPLVSTLVDLYPIDVLADIEAAFAAGKVDEYIIDRKFVHEMIECGETEMRSGFDRLGPTAVDDTFEEIRNWYCYRPQPVERPASRPGETHFSRPSTENEEFDDYLSPPPIPRLSAVHPAGRNDPCPCGSGKKYKKCCGIHAS
jgi:hypothetical protein